MNAAESEDGLPQERRRRGVSEVFQQKNKRIRPQPLSHEPANRLKRVFDKMLFRGVTGFDGLYFEKRATQCTPAHHVNLAGTKLAKNTLASVKSPYFGMADFAFARVSASA